MVLLQMHVLVIKFFPLIGLSENKMTAYFGNEVGPEAILSNVQQTCAL